MKLKQGMIATALVRMPNGKSKPRPVVIATPTELISARFKVRVIGISCSYRPDDPDIIPLPWHSDGNVHTGLRRPSAISLALQDDVDADDLAPTERWIGKPALIELLEWIKERRADC